VSAIIGVKVNKDTVTKIIHLSQLGLLEQDIKAVGFDKLIKIRIPQ
jgi:hypothetical protein